MASEPCVSLCTAVRLSQPGAAALRYALVLLSSTEVPKWSLLPSGSIERLVQAEAAGILAGCVLCAAQESRAVQGRSPQFAHSVLL